MPICSCIHVCKLPIWLFIFKFLVTPWSFSSFLPDSPSHNKMHQQAWLAVILSSLSRFSLENSAAGVLHCHPALRSSWAERLESQRNRAFSVWPSVSGEAQAAADVLLRGARSFSRLHPDPLTVTCTPPPHRHPIIITHVSLPGAVRCLARSVQQILVGWKYNLHVYRAQLCFNYLFCFLSQKIC